MLLKNRQDRLEAESSVIASSTYTPARPPTQALEIMLEALEKRYLRPLPERPDMSQAIARELLNRKDASLEAIKMAQRHLAGERGH